MTNREPESIEDFMKDKEKKAKPEPKGNWQAFIQGEVVAFINEHGIEKITLEDGHGNKAKLVRQKDDGIKVECSSTTML